MERIGLFGGSFNPVHCGHLHIARLSKEMLSLDRVVFIPSGNPPHKEGLEMAGKHDRLNMTHLAANGFEYFSVSDYEVEKDAPSYSVETVKHFVQQNDKETKWFFIMGGDSLLDLGNWRNVSEFLSLCEIICVNRQGDEGALLEEAKETLEKEYHAKIHLLLQPPIPLSSTAIREKIRRNENIDSLVPETVSEYIKAHGLYL